MAELPSPPTAAEAKIEISLNRLSQLFNSLDPSPFHERDLDQDAEDYIISSAEEIGLQRPIALIVHLPADQLPQSGAPDLGEAIHNYFTYREAAAPVVSRRPHRSHQRIGILVLLRAVAGIGVFLRQRRGIRYFRRRHADHRLGRDVAALGDFSLRMGADSASLPGAGEAGGNAGHHQTEMTRIEIQGLTATLALRDTVDVVELEQL